MTDPVRNVGRAAGAPIPVLAPRQKPKAVLYARCASTIQNDQPCERQLRLCRETALRKGFEIAGEYQEEATSGRSLRLTRPGICAMKERVAQGDITAVIIEDLERIGRCLVDLEILADWLEDRGVELHAALSGKFERKLVKFPASITEHQSHGNADRPTLSAANDTPAISVSPPSFATLLARAYAAQGKTNKTESQA